MTLKLFLHESWKKSVFLVQISWVLKLWFEDWPLWWIFIKELTFCSKTACVRLSKENLVCSNTAAEIHIFNSFRRQKLLLVANQLQYNTFFYLLMPLLDNAFAANVKWKKLSVKARMGNREKEWGEWWERGESGWEYRESGWERDESREECRESGWECGGLGWECRELEWECGESGWECREWGWESGESGWECKYINTWQVFYKDFTR